jgi:membrane protease YdiL (CAAX protease family)
MNGLPEREPDNDQSSQVESGNDAGAVTQSSEAPTDHDPETRVTEIVSDQVEPQPPALQTPDQPMFQQWYVPPPRPPVRIPHMGHLGILMVFVLSGVFAAGILMQVALHYHLFGVPSITGALSNINYTLGTELIVYAVMFGAGLIFFPMIWHKGFFAGIQWNGATALRLQKQMFITAAICFVLALVNGLLLPSPKNAPIDKIFRTPGAAWLLFGFGITFAPFFEEMIFRGFILPSLCTAWDWAVERSTGKPALPLADNGHPQWTLYAMVFGSVATSVPFAAMHAAQTGYSWGPFVLLVGVSLVLCWARLSTRSLAASVMVHASYNFLLFSLMLIGTGGFRHMDKL